MADKLFLSHIDLNKNELKNALIHKVDTMPSSPKTGQLVYWNGTTGTYTKGKLYIYDGSAWKIVGSDVYNASLSLQANGTTKTTFTANDSTNRTFNIANGTSTTGNGTISVGGAAVSVYGLGSAAYTSSDIYAKLAGGTSSAQQEFTGYNKFTNSIVTPGIATPGGGSVELNNGVKIKSNGYSLTLDSSIGSMYFVTQSSDYKAYYYHGSGNPTANDEIAVKGDIPTLPSNIVTGSGLTANTIILGNGSSTVKTSSKTITTTLGTNDTTVPTSKAAKTYIDAQDDKLSDRIDNISTLGRYLTGWDMTTGTPTSLPLEDSYTLQTGDYFIVTKVNHITNITVNGSYGSGAATYDPSEDISYNGRKYYCWALNSNPTKKFFTAERDSLEATDSTYTYPFQPELGPMTNGSVTAITAVTNYKPNQTGTWTTSQPFAKTTVTGSFIEGGIWKYNGSAWEYQETGGSIGLQPFTNTSIGGIKGKENAFGYVMADGDGYGRVYGMDDVVTLSGEQTISGQKNFRSAIKVDGSVEIGTGTFRTHSSYTIDTYSSAISSLTLKTYGLYLLSDSDKKAYYYTANSKPSTDDAAREIAVKGDIPTSFTLTDDILDGSANKYAPYTSKGAGHLYTGTTAPSSSNRLNYDGYFYASRLYSNGTEVITSHDVPSGSFTMGGPQASKLYGTTISCAGSGTANTTISFPSDKSGTVALLSDIPSLPTNHVTTDTQQHITATHYFDNGLNIGSTGGGWISYSSGMVTFGGHTGVTLDGGTGSTEIKTSLAKILLAPGEGYKAYYKPGGGTVADSNEIATKGDLPSFSAKGSTTKPVYLSGTNTFAECSTYAGGTAVTLNGTSKAASTASFYAPTGAGTAGQILTSSGSGAPVWAAAPKTGYKELALTFSGTAGEYYEVIKTTAPIQVLDSNHAQVECKIVYSYTSNALSGATIIMNADSTPSGYVALCIDGSTLA